MELARRKATGSGRAMARFLGNNSPKSIWITVENISARIAPTATATPVGMPTPPARLLRERPMSGSAA